MRLAYVAAMHCGELGQDFHCSCPLIRFSSDVAAQINNQLRSQTSLRQCSHAHILSTWQPVLPTMVLIAQQGEENPGQPATDAQASAADLVPPAQQQQQQQAELPNHLMQQFRG